jgi:NDP-sugar pyrophosphorylase family protein
MEAIILAGGKGERLRPFTEDRPKPMVEILGIPILGYQIRWLVGQGVTDVVIACGYRHEVIQGYFDDGAKWGCRIRYAIEDVPLGRGGGLKQALRMTSGGRCLATNGDVLTNVRIADVVSHHERSRDTATIVLAPFTSPYGIVDVADEDRIVGFREKPELPYWINAGIYVMDRSITERLPDVGDHETTTFPALVEERKLGAFKSRSYWRAVDTIKDLSEVSKELEQRLLAAFLG